MTLHKMRSAFIKLLGLGLIAFVGSALGATAPQTRKPVAIGVLAERPVPQVQAKWQPLATALKQAIPSSDFVIKAMAYSELNRAVADHQVDFVLTNPGHYVLLRQRNGLSAPLATLSVVRNGHRFDSYGGVIFTLSKRTDINSLSALIGKTIAVVNTTSLSGYQSQVYALYRHGVRVPRDVRTVMTGPPFDNVVNAVLGGHADAGFVRTATLEVLQQEGKLDLSRIKVLNRQSAPGFPFQMSTQLYPEWPFAAQPDANETLTRRVAAALFLLADNPDVIKTLGIDGFVAPASYASVEDMLRAARLPPYDAAPAFNIVDVWLRYKSWIIGLAVLTLLLAVAVAVLAMRSQQLRSSEARFRQFFEHNSSVMLLIAPGSARIVDANPAAAAYYGYTIQQLIGMHMSQINTLSPDEIAEEKGRVLREGRTHFFFRHRLASGDVRDVEVFSTLITSDRKPVILEISHDITERKLSEEQLRLAATVFTHAREGIMITDASGAIIDVNESFTYISGFEREEVLGRNPSILNSGHHNPGFWAQLWQKLVDEGHWYGEIWNRRKNGELFAEMLNVSAVRDTEGNIGHFVSLFNDITMLKEHERQLEFIAHYDPLTRLPNRRLLTDRLQQAMVQADRRSQKLAVVFLDLDGFKCINDRYGHEIGDQALMAIAANMAQVQRDSDTLSRLGGDEFVAIARDLADEAAVLPFLSRLLAATHEQVVINDVEVQVSASIGVAFYPQAGAEDMDPDLLLRQADQAMYQAKQAGKNRYHVFDAQADQVARSQHESIARVRQGLLANEFTLHYQPKVNMRSGRIIGVEALIRWQHPEHGRLLPQAFLPTIENNALAVEMGEWVLDRALRQMTLWSSTGLELPISVNVSARQLQQGDFVTRLKHFLAAYPRTPPSMLTLEILETSALEDWTHVTQVIEECRMIGVQFAIDDFGTGYASLAYLKRLSVTQLKIAQDFVRDILDDPEDLSIVDAMLGLATAFRREAVAEGVETIAHGSLLLQLGCDLAQGFGIAHPMPAELIPDWVSTWQAPSVWTEMPQARRQEFPMLFAGIEHGAWIATLEQYLKGECDTVMGPQLHSKKFGQWLSDEGSTLFGDRPGFTAVSILHRRLHELAQMLLDLNTQGKNDQALARLQELHQLRDQLLTQLSLLLQVPKPSSSKVVNIV